MQIYFAGLVTVKINFQNIYISIILTKSKHDFWIS